MSEFKTNKISPRKGTTQTIGDSGDTVSIPSGVTLSNAGTISGIQKIDWDTTKKTSAFTAVSQTGYFVDTTSAAITVTFPATPSAGNVIGLKDYANTFDTNNLTIDPNGNKIQGLTTNFTVSDEGAALNFIYVDSTRGWVLTDASKASDIVAPEYIVATGGTITCCGDYKIHTFTGPGTFTVCSVGNPFGGPNNVDYLVSAGGGGGGADLGGGGGAGGLRKSFPSCGAGSIPVTAQGYPITVGGGGSGGSSGLGSTTPGNQGSNSIFSTITSTGGGYGAKLGETGGNGGSGGGGGGASSFSGVPGPSSGGSGNTPPVSPSQGNNGGNSGTIPGDSGGGGGGGAGGVGSNSSPSIQSGGPGGVGVINLISGSPVTYSSGARGGSSGSPGSPIGGGGGGGGAAYGAGGNGNGGIVIIRYKFQ
jgi:hypothetical protein